MRYQLRSALFLGTLLGVTLATGVGGNRSAGAAQPIKFQPSGLRVTVLQRSVRTMSAVALNAIASESTPDLSLGRLSMGPEATTPAEETTAAEDAAETGLSPNAQMTLTGLGPIQIGMLPVEAARVAGVPLDTLGEGGATGCRYLAPRTLSDSVGLMVVSGKIIRIDVWGTDSIKTLSGVGIGSTEAEVRATYPDQIEETPRLDGTGKYLTYFPDENTDSLYRLVFEVDESGKVVQFRTGQFPAVGWSEGCD
jgi:hypothetical protein